MMSRERGIKETLSQNMLRKLGRQVFLFLIATGILTAVGYYLLRQRIWYESDLLYWPLHAMHENLWICASVFLAWLAGGLAVICCRMIYRLIRHVEEITQGVENLYEDTGKRVKMSPELYMVEEQLNNIRENVMRNRQAAREAEQRKMDLVLYLAHDLKTPLTSVIGYLTLLHEEKDISENLRERYLGVALEKSERLEELTDEFFEIARFNLSEIVLEISQVNVSVMLEQMAYEFRPLFEEKKLAYRLALEENVMMPIDADKMSRVFDNLLKNAFYYSYEGSEVVISLGKYREWSALSTGEERARSAESGQRAPGGERASQVQEQREIEPTESRSVQEKGEALTGFGQENAEWKYFVCFENQGKTIPPKKREQIFEQFFRMEAARGSSTGGAGLGLAIAREIVRRHGGEIVCESGGERIRFTIFL